MPVINSDFRSAIMQGKRESQREIETHDERVQLWKNERQIKELLEQWHDLRGNLESVVGLADDVVGS